MTRPLWKTNREVRLAGLRGEDTVRAAVLLLILSPILAFSQTDVWKGGSGSWGDTTKWSAGVPTATSNVLIDNGNGPAAVTLTGGYACNNLTIDADASLTIAGQPGFSHLDISGTSISNAGQIVIDDTNGDAWLAVAAGQNAVLSAEAR